MAINDWKTGDDTADRVLKFVASHCLKMRGEQGELYRNGDQSMFFNWRYLAFQLDISEQDAMGAIDFLVGSGFVRAEPMMRHGVDIWLLCKIGEAA